jgi:hypothetical protein
MSRSILGLKPEVEAAGIEPASEASASRDRAGSSIARFNVEPRTERCRKLDVRFGCLAQCPADHVIALGTRNEG